MTKSWRNEALIEVNEWLDARGRDELDCCRVCFDLGFCEGRKPGTATCADQMEHLG